MTKELIQNHTCPSCGQKLIEVCRIYGKPACGDCETCVGGLCKSCSENAQDQPTEIVAERAAHDHFTKLRSALSSQH